MKRLQVLLFALLSTTALARGPDGTLALIQTPNNGIPVIVKPGTRFEALVTEKTTSLKLEGPKTIPLDATWTPLPGGKMRATCTVPADAPIGTYALEAVAGDRTDSNSRSVFVRESFPKTYVVAHPTDTHIGSNRNPRTSEAIFSDVITAVNGSDAAFVVITGDLTENGNADQFRSFLKVLDRCRLPTYVCAGNHDRQGLNYEQFFGPDTYMFWFGEDGYISFDTKDRSFASEWGEQDAHLQVFRRTLDHARWVVGFSHRYEIGQGMRSQLILFVDNPLDYLIFGHWHRDSEDVVPWGTTPYTATAAAINGTMRYFVVSPRGVRSRRSERVAKIRER